ncbi:hypothetical protein PT974_12141 [Cladobotryum mycophilum]|uniref:Uncharacterized protein n=1 Tax=Cladobotryum mycophilum TaxID=491253 RepID=A0ABR0S899_9HYPO
MKSFVASVLAIIALASTSTAAPAARGVPGNVQLCTGSNWNGCEIHNFDITTPFNCQPLPSRFTEHLGSIGPDAGAICRIYTDSSCAEKYNTVITQRPGIDNLYSYKGKDVGHTARFILCGACSNCL